jgi:transcriptional regulator of acetoin/glycerol metabolism
MLTRDMSRASCHLVADERDLRAELERVLAGRPTRGMARQATVESWRRATALGLRPDRFVLPFCDDLDTGSTLELPAAPVLDDLAEELAGTEISVVLADSRGRIVARRVPDRHEAARLDHVNLIPGYDWAFEHVGTNGLSDALREAAPSWSSGAEHFFEALSELTTVGVPIRDPRSGQVVGVLALVCSVAAANSLLLPMASRAARDLEQQLLNGRPLRVSRPDREADSPSRTPAPRRSTFGWDSLTETELSVTELVAEGLTNRQIANKLWRSRYTIDAHLRHIFHKLGINSRVELVRIATSRHLTGPRLIDEAAVA